MLLKNKDKILLLNILKQDIQTKVEVRVFGSRVNGRAHSGSDLDLVLCSEDEQPLDINEFMQFKEDLRASNIPFLVDVLDWNRMPDYFQDNINQRYEVLKKL